MSMFMNTVGQLNKRGAMSELDDNLAHVIQQVRATGKPGKLVYTLTIKPQDNEGETVHVEDKITISTAPPIRKPALFFTTEDGRLTRDNPDQPELPITAVDGGKKEAPQPAPAVAVGQ